MVTDTTKFESIKSDDTINDLTNKDSLKKDSTKKNPLKEVLEDLESYDEGCELDNIMGSGE